VVEEPLPESQAPSPQEVKGSTVHQPADMIRVPLERLDDLVRLVSESIISRSVYEQHLGRLSKQVEELHLSIDRLQGITATIETQYEVSALVGNQKTPRHQAAISHPAVGSEAQITEFDALEFDRYSEFHLVSRELTENTADIGALGNELSDILGDFDSYLTRQSRLTSEIQDKLMQLRMVPLATLATRLHRAVRVTARERGKNAVFILEGEEVEFDKTMLGEMADPLLHLLRNAVDHGIESPALRQELGKDPQGQIRLRAFREGTQIVIQASDDGAGLDPQRLRSTAVQRGFVSEAEAAQLTNEQLYMLIFSPGFSTAQEVSEVSGRGVGMDIVQSTVSRLKGRVVLDSTPGQGSTCTIRLPLTLAIARVLLVEAHNQTFAIPLADVTQIVRLESEAIERLGETPVIRVDGQVLPVFRLGEQLGLQQPTASTGDHLPIVITQVGDKQVALVVDQLLGGREVVVKTLGSHLRRVEGVIGSTLMGDGSIVLILNPTELVGEMQRRITPRQAQRPSPAVRASEALEILIVDDSFSVRRVVANLIKSVGWRTVLAKDGVEALDIIQRAARLPDLILLDVEMPQMDGYELTSTLRAHPSYCHVPIVMLTSRSGEKHRQKAFEVGATDYMVKPYQDDILLETVRTVRRLVPRVSGTPAA
jgi:chemosensory pili system protein ChpA (sensor histidine kinase/response regulator)